MSFTTLAIVKTTLNITDTSQDALLTLLVDSVNSEFLHIFHLTSCDPTVYVNEYDIIDSVPGLWLQQYPVISVDAVEVHGIPQAVDTYYLEARVGDFGCLMRKFGGSPGSPSCWPVGSQAIKVTHTAGWIGGTPEAALVNAATLLVMYQFNTGPKIGFQSERIGQYQYKLGSGAGSSGVGGAESGGWPGPVARILANYIRPFVEGA